MSSDVRAERPTSERGQSSPLTTHDSRLTNRYGVETIPIRPAPAAARRMLVAFAHPDDETFGIGSTLARYAAEGVAIHYACATRGEVGEVDPALLASFDGPGALRQAELLAAARELGLAAVHFLGYRDSGMVGTAANADPRAFVQAPLPQVARQLVALIRATRPQVVVTFNPYGGYGHPDHIHIHRATLAAFGAAGDPAQWPELAADGLAAWEPPKLYFNVFGVGMLRVLVRGMRLAGRDPRRFGTNADVDLVEAIARAGRATARLDNRDYAATKERASALHRSQLSGTAPLQRLPRALRHRFLGQEAFMRVIPPAPPGTPPETDLFAGITAEG